MRKKIIRNILAALLCCSMLSGCGEISKYAENMNEYYISSSTMSANSTATSLKSMINRYMAGSKSEQFNSFSIDTIDIIVKDGKWKSEKLRDGIDILENLENDFGDIETASIKVFYQNNECKAVAFIKDKDTIIEIGKDCPNYTETGFEPFAWSSTGKQINNNKEIVGLYPAPIN